MGGRSTPSHRVADISACGGCRPVDATGTYQDRYRRRLLIGPFFKTLARFSFPMRVRRVDTLSISRLGGYRRFEESRLFASHTGGTLESEDDWIEESR